MPPKICFVVDYKLNEYNSVRDILYNIICHPGMSNKTSVLIKWNGHWGELADVSSIEGYKTYSTHTASIKNVLKAKKYTLVSKIRYVLYLIVEKLSKISTKGHQAFKAHTNSLYIKQILKKEKPSLVVLFNYDLHRAHTDICQQYKIPCVQVLYDTYISRPGVQIKSGIQLEKYVIEHSTAYFVPGFFYADYLKHYDSEKITKYNLPLLISKENVISAYQHAYPRYHCTYFGQIQQFRNADTIKKILEDLHLSIDVFSTKQYQTDDTFRTHSAVTGKDLFQAVADSKFLIAFDNSAPYDHYLPSKAYLYTSFTKPVIAFGDNEHSALKEFFKDYPYFYYQNINEPLDGLRAFLEAPIPNAFDEQLYNQYLQYSPQIALQTFVQLCDEIIGTN